MTRPIGQTREQRRRELANPQKYRKPTLLVMLRTLDRQLGITVAATAYPYAQWSIDEIITEIIDREYSCRVCRGMWAHRIDCPHYEPCPVGHPTGVRCPECKKPNREQPIISTLAADSSGDR